MAVESMRSGPIHVRASEQARTREPAFVLIHGLVVSSRYMVPTARELGQNFRVYAPDLPGFGLSADPSKTLGVEGLANTLAAWMDREGLHDAVLVGNSFGCQIILEFALRFPERVSRIVLVGPTVDPRARTAIQQALRLAATIPWEHPGLNLVMLRDLWDAGIPRFLATLKVMLDYRIEDTLPQVQVPTLVVRGGHDRIAPQRWAEEATNLLPCGRLVVVPGVGHAVNYTAPRQLTRAIRTFIAAEESVV